MTPAKGYAKMKDSGIEWVGMIPATWDVFPAGGVFDEVKEKNVNNQYSNPFSFRYGEIVDKIIVGEIDESVEETLSAYRVVSPNTIMINGLNLNYDFISQRVAIVREKGIITSAYLAVQPDEGRIVPRFVLYLLKAYDYRQVFHGVGSGIRKTLKFQDFKSIKIVAPSLTEQTAIAAYLDTQCAKIDEIIAQAKASIEDYKQWKASIIYEAVTKGLNPNVEMKDSGVEWIGKVPKRWACCKQKCVMKLINGRAYKDDEFETEGKYRVLRVGNLFSNPKWYYSNLELEEDKYCNNGDLLYAWSMSYGPVIWNGERVIYHYHIWKTKLSKELTTRFAYYYLIALSNNIKAESHATTMGFVTMKTMNNSYVAFPSLVEQSAITTYLDTQCAKIDDLVSEKQSFIDDLESYKKSLIYEVVTGKRRV